MSIAKQLFVFVTFLYVFPYVSISKHNQISVWASLLKTINKYNSSYKNCQLWNSFLFFSCLYVSIINTYHKRVSCQLQKGLFVFVTFLPVFPYVSILKNDQMRVSLQHSTNTTVYTKFVYCKTAFCSFLSCSSQS